MTKITPEIATYIREHFDEPNRQLSRLINLEFDVHVSYEAIRKFKIKNDKLPKESWTTKNVVTRQEPKILDQPKQKISFPGFPEFMKKLEKSDSYSGKLLKEKLNVRGKMKQINRDRILRIIQYTLDIVKE